MDSGAFKHKLGIVILCIIINTAGSFAATSLNLPIWLDTVGTCLAAYFAGPIAAALAGGIGGITAVFVMHGKWVYVFINAISGFLFYASAKRGYFDKPNTAVASSALVGIANVILSVPYNLHYSNGRCGNFWGDAFFDMLEWQGFDRTVCAFGGAAIVDIIDKQICVGIACLIIMLLFKCSRMRIKNMDAVMKTLVIFITISAVLAAAPMPAVKAAEAWGQITERSFDENYVETIYGSRDGMPYSEANAITETKDGCIWIGGYAGLTKYNGREFEFISGITGVHALMTDSRGRLWIGTNDSGIVVYDNGEMNRFTTKDGLPSNAVRSIIEASDGSMYIGSTGSLCRVRVEKDKISDVFVMPEEMDYAVSMTLYGDKLAGVTNDGNIFVAKDDELLYTIKPRIDNIYYKCVSVADGHLVAGTSEGYIEDLKIFKNRAVTQLRIELSGLNDISAVRHFSDHRIWICADNGTGYLKKGKDGAWSFYAQSFDGFNTAISGVHEDYEGNIWFVSQSCGVMKLSKSKFSNLFLLAGVDADTVNAVCRYNGDYYCGTENGLVILREGYYGKIENEISRFLEGTRIRSIAEDAEGRLWFGTYGQNGLVTLDAKGHINSINIRRGMTDEKFRCMTELSGGIMAAGTAEGINFVDEGHVIGTITQKDGLANSQILSLYENPDGILYAATNGAGIYVIKNGKIIKNIGFNEGLTADVVLKLVPYKTGFFAVTGNSICYVENDAAVHLDSFPYYDNFDIIIDNEKAYVLTSAGIYMLDADALKENNASAHRLFNYSDGLMHRITSNSQNFADESGRIFFCTSKGVDYFRAEDMPEASSNYKSGILVTLKNGDVINEQNGVFTIPANTKIFTVRASIRKYSLSDVKVKCLIDGINDEAAAVSSYDIEPIQISNLHHGSYKVRLQIFNNEETRILQEKEYILRKEAHVWENAWYMAYLAVVCLWTVIFLVWICFTTAGALRRKRQLELLRRDLENKVNIQTEEIRGQAERMEAFQWEVIESMASLIESRDGNTGNHVKNVSRYVSIIVEEMLRMHLYSNEITPKYVDIIIKVAPLHDVGKIKISDVILNKPGKFTPEEYAIMKNHAAYGGMIVEDILGKNADPEMIQIAKDIAYYHHEKWNGSGYPEGKAGDDIPLAARIMAVADVFDALVSKRVYKEAFEFDQAFGIIEEEAGKHFDAEIVRVFLKKKSIIMDEIKNIAESHNQI